MTENIFEEIKTAIHKMDLEYMQQADVMACIDDAIDRIAERYNRQEKAKVHTILPNGKFTLSCNMEELQILVKKQIIGSQMLEVTEPVRLYFENGKCSDWTVETYRKPGYQNTSFKKFMENLLFVQTEYLYAHPITIDGYGGHWIPWRSVEIDGKFYYAMMQEENTRNKDLIVIDESLQPISDPVITLVECRNWKALVAQRISEKMKEYGNGCESPDLTGDELELD